jgi:hypothetical protein
MRGCRGCGCLEAGGVLGLALEGGVAAAALAAALGAGGAALAAAVLTRGAGSADLLLGLLVEADEEGTAWSKQRGKRQGEIIGWTLRTLSVLLWFKAR